MRPAILAPVVALAMACSSTEPSAANITATTNALSYAAGSTVTVAVHNDSDKSVTSGNCTLLQQHVGDSWVSVPDGPCPGIEFSIGAGKTSSASVLLPSTVPAGEYRVAVPVSISSQIGAVYSNTFAITASAH